jgi:FkbM family methyltransferase
MITIEKNNLIFDLGFHKGEDTEYYLSKGYKVVAVEANKELYQKGIKRFQNDISKNYLTLINKAIYGADNCILSFYINENNSTWGSIKKELAEQDSSQSKEQEIETITYKTLCKTFGVPYYCKVDIESADLFVATELPLFQPEYVSFELSRTYYLDIFYHLKNSGYTKFQLRNQFYNKDESSGEFGEFLPEDKWFDVDETLRNYIKFNELRNIDYRNLSFGWMDIHAKK